MPRLHPRQRSPRPCAAASASSFSIDTCPPDANCLIDSTTTIEITAPCVQLRMQIGQFVEVQYLVQHFYACQQSLEVRSLPRWGALDNPAGSDARLLLAVVDGGAPFAESAYTVEPQLLTPCAGARPCGARVPGRYALRFASRTSPDATWDVAPNETRTGSLQPGTANDVTVHNLRSYQTDGCDDDWNFAYMMWWSPR